MNASSLKARFLLIGFLFALLSKFWLVWESEIQDSRDDPHEYVLQILHPANGGLAYPPGTGLVGQFFCALGVPFRLGMEVAFLFASVLLLRALLAWPWKNWLSLALFVLIIFDPVVVELFSQLYSDNVWFVETMLGLSLCVIAMNTESKPRWGCLGLAVLFLGLSSITRSVLVPLLSSAMIFVLLALALVHSKYRAQTLKRHLDLVALTLPTLIFGLCLIYGGTCYFNFSHHGYSGISYIDSDEYKKFYLCLQSVGEPTGDAYFPIDENRRKLIAQAGPDSKWFIRQLEENGYYKQVGFDHYGKYDVPAGWFHWAAFTASMDPAKGDYLDAFSLFHNIEDEIAAASQHDIVKVRTVLPLPDSRISIVAATFPGGLRKTIAKTVQEPLPSAFTFQEGAYSNPDFTKALNRRTVTDSPVRDSIWRRLASLYAWIYTPATFYLCVVVLLAFLIVLSLKWNRLPECPMNLIAPQFFTVFFAVFFLWYALFDASGMPAMSRYMIVNHLLLIPLICYYLSAISRLLRQNRGG